MMMALPSVRDKCYFQLYNNNFSDASNDLFAKRQLHAGSNDPWQVVSRKIFTSYSHLLISTVFVVAISRVGYLGVTVVLNVAAVAFPCFHLTSKFNQSSR